jgi:hypothetical protein
MGWSTGPSGPFSEPLKVLITDHSTLDLHPALVAVGESSGGLKVEMVRSPKR